MVRNKFRWAQGLALVFASVLGCSAVTAQQARDTGLLISISGKVTYQAAEGPMRPAISMIKMRENDRVEMAENARLQIVYPLSGVVENWQGVATFIVGSDRSARRSGAAPAMRELPLSMVESLARGPKVMTDVRQRTGMVVMRSLVSSAEVAAARKRYEQVRAQSGADDVLPDIAYFIELYEANRFAEAAGVLEQASARLEHDPNWREFEREFRAKLGRSTGR